MTRIRIYERDMDALLLRRLRSDASFASALCGFALSRQHDQSYEVKAQEPHAADQGTIDIVVRFKSGPMLLIENKIDAGYSVTRAGHGQPERYQRTVAAYRAAGVDASSVLLAPEIYLRGSRSAGMFDARVAYERLADWMRGEDLVRLRAAIQQAQTPYEPIANLGAGEFFLAIRQLIAERFPSLVMKHDPNANGIRPEDSRTIYFDVPRTLTGHAGVQRPRMSLQCWDKAAQSASVKIMLSDRASLARTLLAPADLVDCGGYLRPAGRSLGITIDTPRLETQRPIFEQVDDVLESLECAARLQGWWNSNADLLRRWGG